MHPHDFRSHPLIAALGSLGLPCEHYAIFGSGPLLAWGIRDEIGDLDIIARGPAWRLAEALGKSETPNSGRGKSVRITEATGSHIDFFTEWVDFRWGVSGLIESADRLYGFPFVPLSVVYEWKRGSCRSRDECDVYLIDEWLARNGGSFPESPVVFDE